MGGENIVCMKSSYGLYESFYTTSIIYNLKLLCYDDDVIKRKAERHRFQKGKRHDYNESLVLPL